MDTAAFIDPSARDRVIVDGPDAQTYLHSQLSQDVSSLAVGDERWTLVLDPTGKVESLARVVRESETTFVLDTDAGHGEALLARLDRFKIRVKADTTLEPAATDAVHDDVEAARVAAGWPRMGAEIVAGSTIPATTGLVPVAVSLTKGCYPGQELVERMDSRGADAPQSLRVLDVDASTVPGDPVVLDGVEVGTITSVSPAGDVALGYVKRGHDAGRAPAHAD